MSRKTLPLLILLFFPITHADYDVNLFSQPNCQGSANRIQVPREDTNPNHFQCTEISGDRRNFYTRSAQVQGSLGGFSCSWVYLFKQSYCQAGTFYNVSCGSCNNVELTVFSVMTPTNNSGNSKRAISSSRSSTSTTSRPFIQRIFTSPEDTKPSSIVNLFSQPNCGGTANRISILIDPYNPNDFQCTEVEGDRENFATKSVQVGFNKAVCQTVTLLSGGFCNTNAGKSYKIACTQGCVNLDIVASSILLTKNDNINVRPLLPPPPSTPRPVQFSLPPKRTSAILQSIDDGDPSVFEVSLFSQSNCNGAANRISVKKTWANPNNFQCTEVAGDRANFYTKSIQTNGCQGFAIRVFARSQCQQNGDSFQLECGSCDNAELWVRSILIERTSGIRTQSVLEPSRPISSPTPRPSPRPTPRTTPRPTPRTTPPPDEPFDYSIEDHESKQGGNVLQHKFHISYTSQSPDGVTIAKVLSINNHFPGPVLYGVIGDTLEVEVHNGIQDGQNVTIHWHGIHQRGTPFEDGPSFVTQCPIKQGGSQTYRVPLLQSGTYWYHSHVGSQYTEGLWGALVVSDNPEKYTYDGEFTITLNDWYHTSAKENEEWFLSPRSGGFPPYPYSALMNGFGQYICEFTSQPCSKHKQKRPVYKLNPGRNYRLRLINTSAWSCFNFAIDGHKLQAIEVDGVTVAPSQSFYGNDYPDSVFIGPGQRYSFILKKVGVHYKEHVMRALLRDDLIGSPPHNINENIQALNPLVTGLIVYTNHEQRTEIIPMDLEDFDYTSYVVRPTIRDYNLLNDTHLIPYDRKAAPRHTDREYVVNVVRTVDDNLVHHVAFNNTAFSLPHDRPLLISMLNNRPLPASSFPLYIDYNNVVQLVVNNPSFGVHPMHLHGHTFWVLGAGEPGAGEYSPEKHRLNYRSLRRDTVMIQAFSWLVIKFVADNPGVWAFHCHIDWHNLAGMALTFVEAPDEARRQLRVPDETRRVCRQHGIFI